MKLAERLSTAGAFVEFLRLQVHEKNIPASYRVRAASACLALAQEHHHAIVLLSEQRLYGPAFSLVRVAFEAYVRGEWIAHSATDAEVESFLRGQEPPKLDKMIRAVEKDFGFTEGNLSGVKAAHWSAMCAYTHTGGLHAQRWQSELTVEPSYEEGEVDEMLKFAEVFGAVSVVALLSLANDEEAIERVVSVFRNRA